MKSKNLESLKKLKVKIFYIANLSEIDDSLSENFDMNYSISPS